MSGSRDGVDIMDYSGNMQCETQVYPRNGMNLVVDEHGKGPFSRVVLEVYRKKYWTTHLEYDSHKTLEQTMRHAHVYQTTTTRGFNRNT
jgi:hypothetical protein